MGTVEKEFPESLSGKLPEKTWSAACRSYGIIWGQMGRGDDCCEIAFEMHGNDGRQE
ncbi:MAG: hypothetical protein V2A71_06215 [Candidatus Eisenbacteria bacterium]